MSTSDRLASERARSRRERGHFDQVVEAGEQFYWADRTASGRRRQELRSELITRSARFEAGWRVLDVGCGTGIYTSRLAADERVNFVAIDVAPAALRVAARETGSNVHVLAADANDLPFPDGCFDAVVGNAVLHHLSLEPSLPELVRVLAPGGQLCFAEPNLLNPQVFAERNIPFLRRSLQNSPDEIAFLRWPLARMLGDHGLEAITVVPFDFLYPLTPRWLIRGVERLGSFLERVPLVREIAGSLLVTARKTRP